MNVRILLAVDLFHHENAHKALTEAVAMARWKGADLHVCYVLAYGHYSYVQPFIPPEVLADSKKRATDDLNALIAGWDDSGVRIVPHILQGGISEQVLKLATEISAVHVVVNGRADAPSARATGPNTAQIARLAPCAVTILP